MASHSYGNIFQDTLTLIFHDFAPISHSNHLFYSDIASWLENGWRRPLPFLVHLTLPNFTLLIPCDHLEHNRGFAFVYMDDDRDAEDAIRGLDRREFGKKSRRLRVEWTKQDRGGSRMSAGSRRSSANVKPSKTLFVINFDPESTRTRDLERHFEPYGKVLNVRIRRNFAFVHFESQEEATKALEATNSRLLDRVISVEYAVRDDDDERRNRYSPDSRGRDYSPARRGRNHGRSASPYGGGRERGSPDYGRGSGPHNKSEQSPVYDRYRSRSPTRRE